MSKESMDQFHARYGIVAGEVSPIHVYRLEYYNKASISPIKRRDFYKIMLFQKANGIMNYADKAVPVNDQCLVFSNPMVPYHWAGDRMSVKGYLCIFSADFITSALRIGHLSETALFKPSAYPALYPDQDQFRQLASCFESLLLNVHSGYAHKYELMRNQVSVILHLAMQVDPPAEPILKNTSYERISNLFLTLLERQFPLWSADSTIPLKNAGEFAAQLGVHTNHLNEALREYTGKTTTEHIAEALVREAKALLAENDWTIAQIASVLGFNHVSNFHAFFKRQTGLSPRQV